MIRFCEGTIPSEGDGVLQGKCLVFNQTIWQKGREYFAKYKDMEIFPVFNSAGQMVCYAWQDQEARREIRMLRELEELSDAIGFRELYPDYTEVTIHGCNELAWCMREYLMKRGIAVKTVGKFWKELGIEEGKSETPAYQNYEIWAEGVHQKSGDWKQEQLRSASVEFECVDKIYEANIKAGKITDADGDGGNLLKKLCREKEIVIRGIGTKAQDAYNWLLENGINICAFQSDRSQNERSRLFGIPIMKKVEVEEKFKDAVVIECASKHSAWGFGGVDAYDYEGYERNKRYLLLRDYTEVPEKNLNCVLAGKNLVLIGDMRLCSRAYRWWQKYGEKTGRIEYWDILDENGGSRGKFQIPFTDKKELSMNDACLLIEPKYGYEGYLTKVAAGRHGAYIEKIREHKIEDYTEYFSDMKKIIHMETEDVKYPDEKLRPAGIVLGAINPHSGNVLTRQVLDSHPNVTAIEEYSFLNNELYFFCIRLAEEKAKDILPAFWGLYESELDKEFDLRWCYFPDREKFGKKVMELTKSREYVTSQELFVIIHLAYNAMYGRVTADLNTSVVYWEPHMWERESVRELAFWFGDADIRGITLRLVRNRYARIGSAVRTIENPSWEMMGNIVFCTSEYVQKKYYPHWEELTVKFEDLKCKPKETLDKICEKLEIPFHSSLMETTCHGDKAFYEGTVTGFDVKPAYNLYEEYFSVFDRMRICMVSGSYQRQYGYPCIESTNFGRRQLQEMFLEKCRWEQLPGIQDDKNEDNVAKIQKHVRYRLWVERFAEIMGEEIDELF